MQDDSNPLNDQTDVTAAAEANPDGIDGTQGSENSGGNEGADGPGSNAGDAPSSDGIGNYFHGGVIPGKSKSKDDTQINVTSGEAVLHRGVVEAMGKPFIDFLNNSIPNVLGGK